MHPPNEESFQAIIENCPDLVCICAPDTTLLYANRTFKDVLGYDPQQLTGSRPMDLVHPEDRPKLQAALEQLAASETSETSEAVTYRMKHADGAWRYIAAQGRNLLSDPAVSGLLLIGRDATEEQLQQQRLVTDRNRQLHYLNRLFQMAQHPQTNFMQSLHVIAKASAKALGVQRCAYWKVHEDPAVTKCMVMYDDVKQNFINEGPGSAFATAFHPLLLEVMISGQPMIVPDVDQDPRTAAFCEYFHSVTIKAVMLMPVQLGDQAVGVLVLANLHEPRQWRKDEAAVASNVAHLISLSLQETERTRDEARFRHLAHHDRLTGLPNRNFLFDQADNIFPNVAADSPSLAAFFIDLDGFKNINDSFGHGTGDELLKAVALRLRNVVRKDDILVRLGGDEFMMLARNLTDTRIAEDIARQIVETMHSTFMLQGRTLQISASVGIAYYPADGTDIDTLMKKADIAMYEAKSAGRDQYHTFTPTLSEDLENRSTLESDLRKAIAGQELQHYYQPQVDLRTGEVQCVEAFLRWPHPHHGLLLPAQFFSMAEEAGLIHDISEWALNDACDQLNAWHAHGLGDLTMAINLSASQLMDQKLLPAAEVALARSNLSGDRLEWEIQESTMVQHNTMIESMLERIAEMRIGLSIDDFGTGYSSFSYLRRYPVHKVKIDRSFVNGLPGHSDDRAIADAIISMAQPLGLNVVAEGVETPEQLEFLREHGCSSAQGYYFTQPLTAEQFEQWLVQH